MSPYAPSTVALAPGPFISLCAGLFIVSQALSQMCTATAPPAWLHILCCATPSSLLRHRDSDTQGQEVESFPKGGRGGQSRMLTSDKLKESRLGHSTVSTHLSLFLGDVSLLFSLTLQAFFSSPLPLFFKLQDTRRIKYK